MKNNNQIINQDAKDSGFEEVSKENLELFRCAFKEAIDAQFSEIEEKSKNMQIPPLSKQHKREMNRICSECTDGSFIPFPEEE